MRVSYKVEDRWWGYHPHAMGISLQVSRGRFWVDVKNYTVGFTVKF